MVGVDRLDYIKGFPEKLRAYETFLTDNPEWVGRAILIQVAIPTRGDVEEYQNLRSLVNELVGRINGKFGTAAYTPIHFMHQSVDFQELLALYTVADVCVVASTRDGMNLVSFEYVACQAERHGSLILSEFAGSAQNLGGAIVVNPWNTEDMARAMLRAVTMDQAERSDRWHRMGGYVRKNTRYVPLALTHALRLPTAASNFHKGRLLTPSLFLTMNSAFWGASFVRELKRAGEDKTGNNFLIMSHDPLPKQIDWRSYDGEVSGKTTRSPSLATAKTL